MERPPYFDVNLKGKNIALGVVCPICNANIGHKCKKHTYVFEDGHSFTSRGAHADRWSLAWDDPLALERSQKARAWRHAAIAKKQATGCRKREEKRAQISQRLRERERRKSELQKMAEEDSRKAIVYVFDRLFAA